MIEELDPRMNNRVVIGDRELPYTFTEVHKKRIQLTKGLQFGDLVYSIDLDLDTEEVIVKTEEYILINLDFAKAPGLRQVESVNFDPGSDLHRVLAFEEEGYMVVGRTSES